MSPHTHLVKIAAAALAGATALGGGVALAALTDAPDETDVSQVERAGALPLDEGAVEDVLPVEDANDAVNEAEDAVKDAEEKAKEAAKDAEEASDEGEEGEDGEGGDTGQRPANHGQVVSNVARTTPPGPGHGKAVSAVARTHGKSVDGGQDDDTDQVEDETDQDGDGGRSGRGRGHGGKRG